MIKANELRVGNRIIVRAAEYVGGRPTGAFNKKEIEVFAIIKHPVSNPDKRPVIMFKDGDSLCEHFLNDDIMPIPLNPELMAKCGFGWDAEEEVYYIQVGNTVYIEYDTDFNSSVVPETWRGQHLHSWGSNKYLHKLQNLYLDHTGEELKINK